MKKIMMIFILCGLLLTIGCGGDDDNGTGSDDTPIVVANTTVSTAPTLSSPDEAVWTSVTEYALDLSSTIAPVSAYPKTSAVSDSVYLKAIVKNDTLYLHLRWDDDDYTIWRDYFEVSTTIPALNFVWLGGEFMGNQEDQLYVMFDATPEGGTEVWDVWNWRVLTTDAEGIGGLAEGMRYRNDSLISDEGTVSPATRNNAIFNIQPTYVHRDTSEFEGYILQLDSITATYASTSGWTEGQRVPGWMIDRTLKNDTNPDSRRKSRFDIKAVSSYDSDAGEYTLVLARALNTGYEDDLDMSLITSTVVKIAILNNLYDINRGGSNRGMTVDFILSR